MMLQRNRKRSMSVSTATPKGQIVIPVELRRRFKIEAGTKVSVEEGDGCIVVRPIGRGRAEDSFGVLRRFPGGSSTTALRRERRRERRR
ncbi:MAG: AbrB/MazE/SpoVT family DNA-binding domain-containing protein [Deltaproteobacteria bacterium]|nr:MAG: AbrB/MazE/SpoVT family DNA-binding domain-containing protein [Deltaproteobacteria bacterium]